MLLSSFRLRSCFITRFFAEQSVRHTVKNHNNPEVVCLLVAKTQVIGKTSKGLRNYRPQTKFGARCYPSMHCRWYQSMPCSRSLGERCLLQGGLLLGAFLLQGGLLLGGLLLGGLLLGRVPGGDPTRWLLLRVARILLECILFF